MSHPPIEEALEYLWVTEERGEDSLHAFQRNMESDGQPDVNDSLLAEMQEQGLIRISGETFSLTSRGKERSARIIRRHRLTERLFKDVLNVPMKETETIACELEHILSPEVTDSVCTFLGHPPLCPHGRPIPRGSCCEQYRQQVKPIICSVRQLELNTPARITFITPGFHQRFQRLTSLGVTPGTPLELKQRYPSFVIQLGETEIAIDKEIADEIFVKRIDRDSQ